MSDYIEGRRAVEEALRAGVPIKRAFVLAPSQRGEGAASVGGLVGKLESSGVPVSPVERRVLDRMSSEGGSHGAHQGIVCEVAPFRYTELSDAVRSTEGERDALVLVLDHITDEGNLGAVIRTAEVVGAACVVIPSKRAAQVTVGVYKTSAGAAFHIPVCRVPNIVQALSLLKEAGFWVAGASERAREDIWHAPLGGRVALVSGSEGTGISRLVLENCDFTVSLPQFGRVGSLNVAQATTAICYEWLRRRLCAGPSTAEGR